MNLQLLAVSAHLDFWHGVRQATSETAAVTKAETNRRHGLRRLERLV